MEENNFELDREKKKMAIKSNGKLLVIDEDNVEISFFSGGPGGQNVNRNRKGVQLLFKIPNEYRMPGKKTTQIVSRVSKKRPLESNIDEAFLQLAEKIRSYFYIPEERKNTKIPRRSKMKRLEDKKRRSQLKTDRKMHDV